MKASGMGGKPPAEVVHSLKRFATDLVTLLFFALISIVAGSLFEGRSIPFLGRAIPVPVAMLIIFAIIFLPLTNLIFHDLKVLLDYLSNIVIRHFPGMQDDLSPITHIMRSLVQIIILFLAMAVIVPPLSQVTILGRNLSGIVSTAIIVVIIIFVYVIARNLYSLTQGYVWNLIHNFFRDLEKRKGEK